MTQLAIRIRGSQRLRVVVGLWVAIAALVIVGALFAVPSSAATATPSPTSQLNAPIMIVMDLSDSMNEDDGTGTVKLSGAKAAINDVTQQIPSGTQVGLWTYPGSGKSQLDGCSLGDSTYQIGAVDPAGISAEVQLLTAQGNTPTGPALGAAVDQMKAAGFTSGVVLLVSDGESNCGTPPCDVAKEIVASGFDVTVAASGFNVSDEGRKELECVASSTGGQYRDVQDSQELAAWVSENAGPQLELTVTGLDATVAGGTRATVKATVKNLSPGIAANAVRMALTFADAGANTVFPSVMPPQVQLGNVPAAKEVSYSWQMSVPKPAQPAAAAPMITVQASNANPLVQKGRWEVKDEPLDLSDAGPVLKDVKQIAILGDSYSAGEGTFTYLPGTDTLANGCHQSDLTYAVPLFRAADNAPVLACSGAVTKDYFDDKKWSLLEPGSPNKSTIRAQDSQLETMLGNRDRVPDAVLLTFGGNDVGFASAIARCAGPEGTDCTLDRVPKGVAETLICPTAVPWAGPDAPFSVSGFVNSELDKLLNQGCVFSDKWTSVKFSEIENLHTQLEVVYRDAVMRVNSNSARSERDGRWAPVIVLGYPQVLSGLGSCSHMTGNERDFGIEMGWAVNREVSEAVSAVAATGLPVYYASDVGYAMLPDHTVCAEPDESRWVNPVAYPENAPGGDKSEQMHPNVDGYEAMTSALIQWSTTAAPLPSPDKSLPDSIRLPGSGVAGDINQNLNQWVQPGGTIPVDMNDSGGNILLQAAPQQPLQVTASGLAPGSQVLVTMQSLPRAIGTLVADDSGRVDAALSVPSDATRGSHVIILEGTSPEGGLVALSRELQVVQTLQWWWLVVAGLSIMAIVGAGVMLWRRRQLTVADRNQGYSSQVT